MSREPLAPGVWQILPTPFRDRQMSVDQVSLSRLTENAAAVGAAGVVALGVLGEAARLSTAERDVVLKSVLSAAGDTPVVAGVSAMATAPALEQAIRAADLGADAVMVLVNTADSAMLAEHLAAISAASGLGVVVQDHPQTTGISIPAASLIGAIKESQAAVALKAEAPPTPSSVASVTGALPGLPVFGGLGGVSLMDELAAGAAGAMTGFAFPEALVAAVSHYRREGFTVAKEALQVFLPVMVLEAQGTISLAVRKELLRRRGLIDEAAVRPPGPPLPLWAAPIIDAHLNALRSAGVFDS
jgi:4-hydroxy-tetrahydrodipicolinate synthase